MGDDTLFGADKEAEARKTCCGWKPYCAGVVSYAHSKRPNEIKFLLVQKAKAGAPCTKDSPILYNPDDKYGPWSDNYGGFRVKKGWTMDTNCNCIEQNDAIDKDG